MAMSLLPIEAQKRIFIHMTYQSIASSSSVCRTWEVLASDKDLWRDQFKSYFGVSGFQSDVQHLAKEVRLRGWKHIVKLIHLKYMAAKTLCERFKLALQLGHPNLALRLATKHSEVMAGHSVLHTAAQMGCIPLAKLALQNGFVINDVSPVNHTIPIYMAAQEGHTDMVAFLATLGGDYNWMYRRDSTSMVVASQRGHLETVQYLVSIGAAIDTKCMNGATALYYAVQYGRSDIVKYLLSKGADQSIKFESFTPIYMAASNGHLAILKLLVGHTNKVDEPDTHGFTPLHTACFNGHLESVKVLAAAGANIHAVANAGSTAVMLAAQSGYDLIVDFLCRQGASTNQHQDVHDSALQMAAKEGHVEVVQCLLKHGADVNDPIVTPSALQTAAKHGHLTVCKVLLNHGANMDLVHPSKGSALFMACKAGHTSIVELLLKKGCTHRT